MLGAGALPALTNRMRLVLLAVLALVTTTVEAVASPACGGPWVPTYRSPQGCPLIMVERAPGSGPLTIEVWRNAERVEDAVADVVTTPIYLDVEYYGDSCDGQYELQDVQAEPFTHYEIKLTNTQPGDVVTFDPYWSSAEIEPAGPCYVVDLPHPECYATQTVCPPPPEHGGGFEISGCSTSTGSAGLPLLLAFAALLRRRRRDDQA